MRKFAWPKMRGVLFDVQARRREDEGLTILEASTATSRAQLCDPQYNVYFEWEPWEPSFLLPDDYPGRVPDEMVALVVADVYSRHMESKLALALDESTMILPVLDAGEQ